MDSCVFVVFCCKGLFFYGGCWGCRVSHAEVDLYCCLRLEFDGVDVGRLVELDLFLKELLS